MTKSFKYTNLNGLNNKRKVHKKISFIGNIDQFTIKTLYENYEIISENLGVYPTVTVYPENYHINGGFTGMYYSDRNHIDLIVNYINVGS